jgi:hypothetical protein
LCPCLEKEEDKSARQALLHLNQVGQCVRWYLAISTNSTTNASMNGLKAVVKNWWGGGGGGDELEDGIVGDEEDMYHGNRKGPPESVLARMILRDNDRGRPELFMQEWRPGDDHDTHNHPLEELHIPLQRIDRIQLDPKNTGRITLYASVSTASSDRRSIAKEWLSLVLLQLPSTTAEGTDEPIPGSTHSQPTNSATVPEVPLAADQRNLAVHHLQVLVEWNKHRRLASPDDNADDDDDDEEDAVGPRHPLHFFRDRAQKVRHFAQREVELQNTKRARETRKAQLVASAGGMKYTALAMAGQK